MSEESIIGEKFTFVWRIENYSSCYQKNGECITSPVFIAESLSRSKWFLKLYPRGDIKEFENYVICFLCRKGKDEGDETITINEKGNIISSDGEILESWKFEDTTYTKGGSQGFHLMKIDDLAKKLQNCEEDTLIIQYHIVRRKPKKIPATGCEAKAKIGVDRCSFQWFVANLDSPYFAERKVFPFPGNSFIQITLTAPEDVLLINIKKIEETPTFSRFVTCRMSLLDVEGVERHSKRDTHLFDAKDEFLPWQFPSFITKTQLNSEEHTFLKNGVFALMCEFSVSSGMRAAKSLDYKSHISSATDVFPQIDTFSYLKEDLRRLFASKKHPDVQLRVGDDIFLAHKSLLSVRSPVFSAMFDQDVLASQVAIVDMPDMDARTLNSFLSFVYTGTMDRMDVEIAFKLLAAADKYQVESLKEICAYFLMSSLSDGNVCEVLVAADAVGHTRLKEFAVDYIKARAGRILPSREWSQLIERNVRLVTEIVSQLSVEFGT